MNIIGTILHGAHGDYYEQLCAIRILRKNMPGSKWVGFFAEEKKLKAMRHFEMDMLDEIFSAKDIEKVFVDKFFQFQINDIELREDIINKLPEKIKEKFNFSRNLKPWYIIKKHDFDNAGLGLELSAVGRAYLNDCMKLNNINPEIFHNKITIGYLWRYRPKYGAVKPYFQRSKEWIIKTKSELFKRFVEEFDAHIIVAGMKRDDCLVREISNEQREKIGFLKGEYRSKYTELKLDIPENRVTYLKALGFAAEMEIMSKCDLLIMMPSGFSEALWMKKTCPVVLVDSPLVYLLKLLWNRMPLFNNNKLSWSYYNNFVSHTEKNVYNFIQKNKLLKKRG